MQKIRTRENSDGLHGLYTASKRLDMMVYQKVRRALRGEPQSGRVRDMDTRHGVTAVACEQEIESTEEKSAGAGRERAYV